MPDLPMRARIQASDGITSANVRNEATKPSSPRCPVAPVKFAELLDLQDDALEDAPAYFELLRQSGPVAWVEELRAYAVTGYEEAVEVLIDTDRFSSQLSDPKGPLINSRLADTQSRLATRSLEFHELVASLEPDWRHPPCLLTADPPLHTRQRQGVNRLFTPRQVAGMEPRIRELAEELVASFVDRGSVELVAEFAVPLPVTVIAEQLGAGTDRLPEFKRWSDHLVAPIGNDRLTEHDILEIVRSTVEFTQYFRGLLEERLSNPQDDFITLLNGTEDPEEDVSEASRLSYIAQLLAAGNETSTKMIADGAARLAHDHALADLLRESPALIPSFVEEVLRISSPLQGLYRTARADTEVGGVPIPAGAHVVVWYAAANRDAAMFPEPGEIDLARENIRKHVAFGKGKHHCVGAPLARAEGVIAFEVMLDRLPNWTIAEELGDKAFERSYLLRGHRRLPIRW
jgi:cytochrome P450